MAREDLLDSNWKIVKGVLEEIKNYCPNTFLIIVTNPLDLLVDLVIKDDASLDTIEHDLYDLLSMAERFTLNLLYILAIKNIFNNDLPLFLDSVFSRFDIELKTDFYNFLQNIDSQVIVLGTNSEIGQFEADKKYKIEVDSATNRSRIVEINKKSN